MIIGYQTLSEWNYCYDNSNEKLLKKLNYIK